MVYNSKHICSYQYYDSKFKELVQNRIRDIRANIIPEKLQQLLLTLPSVQSSNNWLGKYLKYKNKYLKYKNKYLQLKNKLF
jgi:hypothetical protein